MTPHEIPEWLMDLEWKDGVSVKGLLIQGFSPNVLGVDKDQFTSVWRRRQKEAEWMKNVSGLETATQIVDWLDKSSDEVSILVFGVAKKGLLFDARLRSSLALAE